MICTNCAGTISGEPNKMIRDDGGQFYMADHLAHDSPRAMVLCPPCYNIAREAYSFGVTDGALKLRRKLRAVLGDG